MSFFAPPSGFVGLLLTLTNLTLFEGIILATGIFFGVKSYNYIVSSLLELLATIKAVRDAVTIIQAATPPPNNKTVSDQKQFMRAEAREAVLAELQAARVSLCPSQQQS